MDDDELALKKELKRWPMSSRTVLELSEFIIGQGKEEEVIQYLEKAANLDPLEPKTWQLLHSLYTDSWDKFHSLRRIVWLCPDDTSAWRKIQALLQSEGWRRAARAVEARLKGNPIEPFKNPHFAKEAASLNYVVVGWCDGIHGQGEPVVYIDGFQEGPSIRPYKTAAKCASWDFDILPGTNDCILWFPGISSNEDAWGNLFKSFSDCWKYESLLCEAEFTHDENDIR